MKRVILFILAQVFCFMAGFAQSPPWKANGEPISARPDLIVHWQDATKFPKRVWTYQLLPNNFSQGIISNVMALCSFTETNKIEESANGMIFKDGSRSLSFSFSTANIHYEIPEPHYSPTNLAVGVPLISQLPPMATNALRKLHIQFSDITGYFGTNKIEYSEPVFTEYFIGDTIITNIAYRSVFFRRVVDGMPIIGDFYGFNVGEHGKISRLSITWPNLKHIKSYRTISPKDVTSFLRNGNAIQGPVPTSVGDFAWQGVKSVTITKAIPSYMVNGGQLYPFLRMDVTIDIGGQNVRLAIDCPIIDESRL